MTGVSTGGGHGSGQTLAERRFLANSIRVLGSTLPLAYAAAGYGAVWIAGFGGVDLDRFQGCVLSFVVFGFLQNLLAATGEELGWRGYFVPALARTMTW